MKISKCKVGSVVTYRLNTAAEGRGDKPAGHITGFSVNSNNEVIVMVNWCNCTSILAVHPKNLEKY